MGRKCFFREAGRTFWVVTLTRADWIACGAPSLLHKLSGVRVDSAAMSEERRTTHRAHVPGVHATYETASGELQRAEVLDLAVGGLFLRSDAPTAVGKRVALDIVVSGEPAPWSALGRVVWIRPVTLDEERPAFGVVSGEGGVAER